MAHLWTHDDSGWIAHTLSRKLYDLFAFSAASVASSASGSGEAGGAAANLVRAHCAGSVAWALMSAPGSGIRIGGEALPAGLRVLRDRDEIRTPDGGRLFFSTEALVAVRPFESPGRDVFCGRCRQRITAGAPAVRCPGCGVWYDQHDELPCWTYAETCAFCGRSTALDLGFAWVPEGGLA
jgi:hypothetical protein